ncbi:metal ABC transporter permease [Methanothermococcus sp.]|uniref:metal ABC transporter permease n=1 Tax=Methanothermococcus sp. TaxID=2614238 RepID=UPI0025CC9596|nr:metal ABC transporter permease [Methanothermococcus sp.]
MQFILSVITVVFIGGIAGYLGSLMLTKRMALVAGPIGHLALPGVALALVYNFNIFFGALFSIGVGALIIWLFSLRSKIPMEALTAIVFASGVALGFLFLPLSHAEEALIGDVNQITMFDTVLTVFLSLTVFFVIKKIYNNLILSEISEELAANLNVDVKRYNLIYLVTIAVIAAMEVKIVGILLTAALVAIPAAISRNLSKNLNQYVYIAIFSGIISSIIGLFLSKITGIPTGPLIILTLFVFFLISLIFVKK